jgi:hypothetical protein
MVQKRSTGGTITGLMVVLINCGGFESATVLVAQMVAQRREIEGGSGKQREIHDRHVGIDFLCDSAVLE